MADSRTGRRRDRAGPPSIEKARRTAAVPAASGNDRATRDKGSSILRALAVLEAVVDADRPITPTELIDDVGLPKATIHRLCSLLVDEGYLQRNLEGRGLLPGSRLNRFALGILAGARLRIVRHAVLQRVSEEIGETCNISVPDGSEMIYFDRVETHWPLRHQLPVGSRVPLHCTASGKLYLSSLSPSRRRRLLGQLRLERHTDRTLTDPEALEAALEAIRSEGVGVDDEELLDGMIALAVPIRDHKGRFCAALATHAPVQRMSLAQARRHLPLLREGAAQISALLTGENSEEI